MSYTLAYQGAEIDDILARAVPGGALDTAIAAKQDALTFDAVPTQGSTNPAESGGIYDAIQAGGAAALAAFATDSVSGDVVSFPDGADNIPVKSFVGSILPQQNLNGQSAPYPAGGGANIWNEEWENGYYDNGTPASGTGIRSKADSYITITPSTSYYCKCGVSANIAMSYYDSSKNYISNYVVSGGSGVFTTPASAYYLRFHVAGSYGSTYNNNISINYPSTVTTYSPYSNVCPISGWTGANIYRTGVNVWSEEWEQGAYNSSTGERVVNSYAIRAKNPIPVKPNTDYFIKVPAVGARIFWYDINGAFISTELANNAAKTSPASAYFLTFNVGNSSSPITTYGHDVSINYPSTDTDYHAYQGSTILLSFGQTVYAGTLTALGGGLWKIQPTHAIVDMGSLTWVTSGSVRFKSESLASVIAPPATQAATIDAYCSMFKVAPYGTLTTYEIGVGTTGNVFIGYPRDTPLATFVSNITGGKFCYPLATLPDPITITGEDLQTLLGANTVWTDVGAVTGMTYRADTALYIQKLIGGGGTLSTLSMASPSPSLSLGRVGVLAEPEVSEPEETDEEAEQTEQAEEE